MKMVKYRKEFTNILDECLERILVKGESVEQCLQSYPAFANELKPLLKTALITKKATAVAPRSEFRERARFQFRAALQEMEAKKERRGVIFGWQPRLATVVISVVIALVLASSGTIAAASNSMPDSPLYPVKLATETVQLKLATSPLSKAELYAKLSDKRVAELVRMAEKGKARHVEKVASRLNNHLSAMAMAAKANGELAMMMAGEEMPMMEAAPAMPAPQMTAEPAPATEPAPQPEPAPTKPRPVPTPKPVPAPPKIAPAPSARAPQGIAPATPQPTDPSQLAKMQQRAKLKEMMRQKAAANPQAIREALKRAPEAVKSALHQALAVADSGYEQALKALDKE